MCDFFLAPDPQLTDFNKSAPLAKGGKAALDKVTIQAVEHHIHAPSTCKFQNLSPKVQRARVEDLRDPLRSQKVPFARAGRGDDFGANGLGNLYGRLPHAARRGVNQHAFPRLQLGEHDQTIPGGQQRQGQSCPFLITQVIGDGNQLGGRQGQITGKGSFGGGQPHHPLTNPQLGHAGANRSNHARALKAQSDRLGTGDPQHRGIVFL